MAMTPEHGSEKKLNISNREETTVNHSTKLMLIYLSSLLFLFNNALAYTPGSNPFPLEREGGLTPETPKAPVLPLPELPDLPNKEQDNISSVARVCVSRFELEIQGKTASQAFDMNQLREIVKPYERCISAEELQEVKNDITRFYINKGYINSGAIIPDQAVGKDRIIKLLIIEGQLKDVNVNVVATREKGESENKPGWLRKNYVKNRLELSDNALNINALQEKLQLLQQNPLVKRINAELGPGIHLGEGILEIEVEEARPWEFGFKFNNHRSPSVGAYRGEMDFTHRNITGWGDSIYARVGLTEGLKDYTFNYTLPINRYDTTLSFLLEKSDSEVVSEPFNQLDVESEADTYALTLRHPLIKTPNQELGIALKAEKRTSKTYLLGRPFSFSPGVVDGESNISVLRFIQDWLKRGPNQVLAARSSFNLGIDAWDSTIHADNFSPDSHFYSWLGQFQWVKRLDDWVGFLDSKMLKDTQIIFRTDMQFAKEALLPLEKFSIGGASTVRGYRENFLTRDNGLIASLEARIPIYKYSPLSSDPEDGTLELAPFIDYGNSWNNDKATTPTPRDITGAGVGLRWTITKYLFAEAYWAKNLRDIQDPEDSDLQDKSVHFEVRLKFPFE